MSRPAHASIASIGTLAAALACCLAVPACTPKAATPVAIPNGPGSLNGVWLNNDYKGSSSYPERERVLRTVDGELPPMLPWASELLTKRIQDSEAGLPFASTLALCLPGGIPLMLFGDDVPVQILETPEQLTMLFMEGNRFRAIPMNASHPDYVDPGFMGDAVGRWEGDTLVIDNVGFIERTTLDQIGTPHTEKLHVIERYRRTGKESMEISVSIDDPGTFTRPWEARVHYRLAPPGTRVTEDICENNRNPPDEQGRSGFQRF
jgi:hypothetical protein